MGAIGRRSLLRGRLGSVEAGLKTIPGRDDGATGAHRAEARWHSRLSVEEAVLDCFEDVRLADIFGGIEVGDGSRNAADFVVGAG